MLTERAYADAYAILLTEAEPGESTPAEVFAARCLAADHVEDTYRTLTPAERKSILDAAYADAGFAR